MFKLPFFIPDIPKSASYVDQEYFFDIDRQVLLSSLQMVDTAFSDLDYAPNPLFDEFYEIKDVQQAKSKKPVLCSICIFKQQRNYHQKPHGFDGYLQGLKERIRLFSETDDQTLRVYVGDNIWDLLYKEGVLRAKHVDFVRMSCSSNQSHIGLKWRSLAYDDFDYDYVYIDDTDVMSHNTNLSRISLQIGDFEHHFNGHPDVHFHSYLAPPHDDKQGLFYDYLTFDKPLFTNAFFVGDITNYLAFHTLDIIRSPKRFPFESIVPLLRLCYPASGTIYLCDPCREVWTMISSINSRHTFYYAGEGFFLYFLRHHLKYRLEWIRDHYSQFKYDDKSLLWRIRNQLIDDGHIIESC